MHYHGWHLASGIWHLVCQTNALNLIDSHGGQKQAPQQFSSSKSTPLSVKLSPISKWLFKPSLLSKSALVFASLWLLSYTQGAQALSAYTSRAIEGSAPYLTFDGGRTKLTSTDSLLSIELPDGTKYTKSTNPSTSTNPIRLPNTGASFNDINMVVPPALSSITINDLVTQGNWGDDDGDGQATATGSISVTFTDKNGNTVNRSDVLDICEAPYKVTLTSTNGTLTTQYGVPRSSTFSGDSVDYYINPNADVRICYVRVDTYGGEDGPANIWNRNVGFLVQSTSPSSYDLNFPTTGADGFYFFLDVGGVDITQLTWPSVTHSGITATVDVIRAYFDYNKGRVVARVKLSGPNVDIAQKWSSSPPGRITVPSLPQTFELVGRGSSGNEVRYGFVLKQWFVPRGSNLQTYSDQLAWCNSLGYQMPRVRDLTNAKCGVHYRFPCVNGIDGAKPSASNNNYMRHIGAGLLAEWGDPSRFSTADFSYYGTNWTSDVSSSGHHFTEDMGTIYEYTDSGYDQAVCVTPSS